MNFHDVSRMAQNLKETFPDETFVVTAACSCSFFGKAILDVGDWRIFKLDRSPNSGHVVNRPRTLEGGSLPSALGSSRRTIGTGGMHLFVIFRVEPVDCYKAIISLMYT